MEITIKLAPEVACAIYRGKPLKEACPEVSAVADRLSTSLKPHTPPDQYFTLEVPDRATADQIVKQLDGCCSHVLAAYWKPRARRARATAD